MTVVPTRPPKSPAWTHHCLAWISQYSNISLNADVLRFENHKFVCFHLLSIHRSAFISIRVACYYFTSYSLSESSRSPWIWRQERGIMSRAIHMTSWLGCLNLVSHLQIYSFSNLYTVQAIQLVDAPSDVLLLAWSITFTLVMVSVLGLGFGSIGIRPGEQVDSTST
jgi:hypothetical protein